MRFLLVWMLGLTPGLAIPAVVAAESPQQQAVTDDGPASRPADEALLESIRGKLESGALEEAQSAVEAALGTHGDDPHLHLLAAQVFGARARELAGGMAPGATFARMLRLDALSEIGRALTQGLERTPDVDRLEAGLLREDGRLDEAARVAAHGLEAGPRRDLLFELARIRQAQGKPAEAAGLARRCLELDPHDVEAGVLEIAMFESQGLRDEALAAITALARANPQRLDLAGLLWPLHGGVADFKTAVAHYQALAEALPEEAWYRFYLGATRRRAGDLEGAERDLRRALAMRPDLLEITAEIGLVTASQGKLEEAATTLIKVVSSEGPLRETSLPMLLSVGAGLAQQFKFTPALACYEAVLAVDDSNYFARLDRALLLRQMGRTDDSLRAYAEAELLYPGDGNVLNDHALVYLGSGRDAEAHELFVKAAAAGSVDAHENLAMLAWYAGDDAACQSHLEEVLRREPDRVKSRYYLEMVRRRQATRAAGR